MIYENVLELVGKTPLVKINRLNPNPGVTVAAKLERFNPTGSTKDRVALEMIEQAEKQGRIKPGDTLVEGTSGNTGIAFSMIGKQKGYKVKIVMPEFMSEERKKMIKAFGSELVLTDEQKKESGTIEKAEKLGKKQGNANLNQFCNPANAQAHYKTTAREIWDDTRGKVTHFVCSMGTCGTISGVGKRLKELNPEVKVIGAYPKPGHKIQGLINMEEDGQRPIFDENVVDEIVSFDDCDALEMARKIALEEGMFVGMSSGAALLVALKQVEKLSRGLVVVMFADGGEKYLTTELFE
jgi:cysteine synthase B